MKTTNISTTLVLYTVVLLAMLSTTTDAFALAPHRCHTSVRHSPLQAAKAEAKIAAVETVRKADFVASIAEKTGFSKADSEQAFNAVVETIQEEVSSGKKISMIGFGTWKLTHRAARKGRNPKTGEEIDIRASKSPIFTASKTFKERCNGK